MSRFKVILGALFAAGLCICAIGASNASALTVHECAPEGSGGTKEDKFGLCAAKEEQKPVTSYKGLKPVLSSENIGLKAVVGGIEFEIQCTALSGTAEVENVTSGENMLIKGKNIVSTFEKCAVTKPAGKCTVPASITSNSMKSETVAGTTKQKYEPTSGTTLATFTVGGAECAAALKGSKSVTGTVTSEVFESKGEQGFTAGGGGGGVGLKYAGVAATIIGLAKHQTENGTQVFSTSP